MPGTPPSLQEQKAQLRADMRAARQTPFPQDDDAFKALADIFQACIELGKDAIVASYCAFRGEMDPAFLAQALRAKGHKIALPRIAGKRTPLAFHIYEPGDALGTNPIGMREPLASAPSAEPDILLVPLLAFDTNRNRLGYGGGYYDRTIAGLRMRKPMLAIGIAFASQQIPQVPIGPNDIALDKIVTELNVF